MSLEESQGHALVYSVRDMEKMLKQQRELLLEAKERFLAYQMDVDDYPPQEHRHFMGRIDACLNATGEDDEKPNSNIIIGQDAVVGFSTDDRELGIVKEIKFEEMGGEGLLMIRVKTYVTKQNYWWDCNNVQLVALNLR